jgi:hypothetical protein
MMFEKAGFRSRKFRSSEYGELSGQSAEAMSFASRKLSRRLLLTGASTLALVLAAPDLVYPVL